MQSREGILPAAAVIVASCPVVHINSGKMRFIGTHVNGWRHGVAAHGWDIHMPRRPVRIKGDRFLKNSITVKINGIIGQCAVVAAVNTGRVSDLQPEIVIKVADYIVSTVVIYKTWIIVDDVGTSVTAGDKTVGCGDYCCTSRMKLSTCIAGKDTVGHRYFGVGVGKKSTACFGRIISHSAIGYGCPSIRHVNCTTVTNGLVTGKHGIYNSG